MIKIQLIPNAKRVLTATSSMCLAASGGLITTWMLLGDEAKKSIGTEEFHAGVLAVIILGFIGRFLQKIEADAPQEVLVPVEPIVTPIAEKPVVVVTQSTAPVDSAPKEP